MKNRILLSLLALVLIVSTVLVGACAAPAPPTAPAPPPTAPAPPPTAPAPPTKPAWEWPTELLKIMANSLTVTDYLLPVAWTPLHGKDTGAKWRMIAESSHSGNARRLQRGDVDFYNTALGVAQDIIEANLEYATRDGGPFQIRVVWNTSVAASSLFVRGDSDIKTTDDIKPGTRYALMVGSPTLQRLYDAALAYLGMTPEELPTVPFGSYAASCRAIGEGKADISIQGATTTTAYELAASPHGIRFLDLSDKEAQKRMIDFAPTTMFAEADFGVEEIRGLTARTMPKVTYATSDTDPELVYRLAKWLDENFDAYKDLHKEAPRMSIEWVRKTLDNTFVPVHEGVIRYMKEKGMWTAADDARQEYNVGLVTWYIEAYQKAIDMADERGIRIDHTNEEWLELWESYKTVIGIPCFRTMSDEDITAGLAKLK